jgi:general secretion pathway protein H
MDRHGFTLIELLVVLAIIGFGMAIGMTYVSSALPSWQARGAAREVAAALRKTRSRAIFTSADSVFTIDVNRRAYGLSGERRSYKLPPELNISLFTAQQAVVSASVGRIRFFPDGSSTGGRVSLADSKHRYNVTINWLTGNIEVTQSGI